MLVMYSKPASKRSQASFSVSATLTVNSSLGRLYNEKEEYSTAEEILHKQIEIIERTGGKVRCPAQLIDWGFLPYILLSELHLKMGEFKKAKDLADETYEIAVKSKSRLYMAMANRLKGMLSSHEKTDNPPQSFSKRAEESLKP